MNVVISHPAAPPFTQAVLHALHESRQLKRFYTSLAFSAEQLKNKPWQQMLRNRTISGIPACYIRNFYLAECCRLASGKVDRSGVWTDRVWEWSEHWFDRQVANALNSEVDACYSYEHICESTFQRAKELGIRTFYDVPAPETTQIRNLMAQEISNFPEMDNLWFQKTSEREPKRLARRKREWELADTIICASPFTRDTFAAVGYDTSKVKIVPYGAPEPISQESCRTGGTSETNKLNLIWAGTFSLRKGAHYLLEAWRQSDAGKFAELHVYGSSELPTTLADGNTAGISFKGAISRDTLMSRYEQADALIFPTLYDGFGMVVTEALSRGCPVITTHKAGASSFIRSGENGFIIDHANATAISECLEHCRTNRTELKTMREAARHSAARWQWSDYRKALLEKIKPVTS